MMDGIKAWLDSVEIDFVGYRKIAGAASALAVLVSILAFVVVGPNYGIDFTGGTQIQLHFDDDVTIAEVRDALGSLGIDNDAVQSIGDDTVHDFVVRIQDPEFGAERIETSVRDAIIDGFGEDWLVDIKFSAEVGARFSLTYSSDERTPVSAVERVLRTRDITDVRVEEGVEENEIIVKLPGLNKAIEAQIAEAMGGRNFEVTSVDAVGPKVGESLRRQGFTSIAVTLGLVLLYIAFRFDVAFAPGAIVALMHDVTLTVGVFILLGNEFNLPIIGALLTIVGYSLNDTIVIYDRIRENQERHRREDLHGLINVSINETLSRTVATSFTTFLAIVAFLFFGGPVIRDFATAMICGIIFGTYSTVFVASPMIVVMEGVKPWLAGIVATGEPEEEDLDEVPDQFLSETEKRRRERARLERDVADTPLD